MAWQFECWLEGVAHPYELPEGAIGPIPKNNGMDVYGCGLVLDPENKLSIFFTLNGHLLSKFSVGSGFWMV
jgi:hypothetical protein